MKKLVISLIMVGSIYSAGISAAAAAASNPGESAHSEWFSGVRGLPTIRETGEVASDVVRPEVIDYFAAMGYFRFDSQEVLDKEVAVSSLEGLSEKLKIPRGEYLSFYVTQAEAELIWEKTGQRLELVGESPRAAVALTEALFSGK